VVRTPDAAETLRIARIAASEIGVVAG